MSETQKQRLTEEKRQQIRAEHARKVSVKDLAEKYEVSLPTIYNIVRAPASSGLSAVEVLRGEISNAEAELKNLEETISRVESLKAEIARKKQALKLLSETKP